MISLRPPLAAGQHAAPSLISITLLIMRSLISLFFVGLLTAALTGLACASSTPPVANLQPAAPSTASSDSPVASKSQPPKMRLGDAVRPLQYALELEIDPDQSELQGTVKIDIELTRALDFFWINGNQLQIKQARIQSDGRSLNMQVEKGGDQFIGLRLPAGQSLLAAGRATLEIQYRAQVSARDTAGLFRQKDGQDWYVLSQFEASSARRAFPCFDEPQWKTPWTVALIHKKELISASNMPVEQEQDLGNGKKRVQFAATPPLPSYLLAMGVGPFDVVDGGRAGRKQIPLRYFVPRGRAAEAAYAVQHTPRLVALAEEYFDMDYPYPKMDSMVIPITISFAAMENAGLITYRSSVLLAKPGQEPEDFKQRYISIASHEIAHQWFGDLVTMKWWDDLWLNESFATWMAAKMYVQFNPAWENSKNDSEARQRALEVDQLQSTRQVRQKVESQEDMNGAFDSISYEKGGAVLRMFESYLGAEKFRAGVRRYIRKHTHGNADAHDFFAAIADTNPVLANSFASFVNQPGLPLLSMELNCKGKPRVRVRQQRFTPASDNAAAQVWQVPLCMRAQGQKQPQCQIISKVQQDIALQGVKACPAWLLKNADGNGYYLSNFKPEQLHALQQAYQRKELTTQEMVALGNDVNFLAGGGQLDMAGFLPWLEMLAASGQPDLMLTAALGLEQIHEAWLDQAGRQQLAAWLRHHFGKQALELGWLSRPGEPAAVSGLREKLLPHMARRAQMPELEQSLLRIGNEWLDALLQNKEGPALGGMQRPLMESMGYLADQTLVEKMLAAARKTNSWRDRFMLFRALGSNQREDLMQLALQQVLAKEFDTREAVTILWAVGEHAEGSALALQYQQQHWQDLQAKMPEGYVSRLLRVNALVCSADQQAALSRLLQSKGLDQVQRSVRQIQESAAICVKRRKVQEAQLQEFLSKKG